MCIYTYVQEQNDIMPHDPLTRVSECSVAGSAPETMTAMVFQAGVETRSAMACYVDFADCTASADKTYADAAHTEWRMDEGPFSDRWWKTWQSADPSPHPMALGAGRLNG